MKKESGFTLVEILVVIVIIGIVLSSISTLFINIQTIQVQSTDIDLATRAAQTEIESLRNANYTNLTPGQTINFTSQLPTSLPANRQGQATITQLTPELKRIDSTVTYTLNGSQETITISSLIGVIGITQ